MSEKPLHPKQRSVFAEQGLRNSVDGLLEQIRALYLADDIPWVVGYSGGKDSTATLQLVWYAIRDLDRSRRGKPIHVISTDTLVENPIVALWVESSLKEINSAATEQEMPIRAHRLTPALADRYWVNLLGRGYPAPRPKFRWCTSRLKINPSNKFITDIVKEHGEAILVLGTRSAESAARHANMKKWRERSSRDLLSAHGQLAGSWVYTPIADWSNDDVWLYLNQLENPWGFSNRNLLGMYQGATEDGECPLVVDTSTPSCGDSRFGCFVCTLVDQDRSMEAMIRNDTEKEWMLPLLEFRNQWLDIKNDRGRRDFRRMDGSLLVFNDRLVHGPYTQGYRESMLEALLRAEQAAKSLGPPEVEEMELITLEELEEIRRIWVMEKHEIEDRLPKIYEQVTGSEYPGKRLPLLPGLDEDGLDMLKEICETEGDVEGVQYQVIRELLHLEQSYRTMARRSGLFDAMEKALERGAFQRAEEAEAFALRKRNALQAVTDSLQSVDSLTGDLGSERDLQ